MYILAKLWVIALRNQEFIVKLVYIISKSGTQWYIHRIAIFFSDGHHSYTVYIEASGSNNTDSSARFLLSYRLAMQLIVCELRY